jgi:hypothetical protein
MSVLYIAIADGDPDKQRRALEALNAADVEVYRSWIEPTPMELAEAEGVPDRDHLKDQRVRLKLNPWARQGPTEGVFMGQGERGLAIRVQGGGRYTYSHHEVAEVTRA